MTTQLKKAATAVAMAVAFGATAQVAQAAIFFNNLQGSGSGFTDGFASSTNISNFAETLITGVLTQGAGGNAYDGGGPLGCGDDGAHATLNAACLAGSNGGFLYAISKVNFNGFSSAAANSYTMVMKVPVRTWLTSLISPLATLQVTYDTTAAAGSGEFFIYANSGSQPDYQFGTGFNTGTEILKGVAITNPNLVAGTSAGGSTGTSNTGAVTALNQTGLTSNVDGLVDTIGATGTAKDFYFEVTGGSVAYFPDIAAHMVLGFDLSYNQITLDAPFTKCSGGATPCDPRPTTDWTQAGGIDYTPGGLVDLFGSDTNGVGQTGGTDGNLLNNFTCGPQDDSCGYIGKGLLSASLITPNLPEPGALALMGIGLVGLGAFSRRRRNK